VKHGVWLAIVFCGSVMLAADCPKNQPKDGSALIQHEQDWAEALARHDAEAVGCILADDFQDVDPDGKVHDRTETLPGIPHRKPGTNRLSELTPHVYGDVGYIRGLATLVDTEGNTVAQVRFTDIYLYRDGRWLAVAGQESLLPKEKAK
jgi:ketosteroid isomerase-like protein